jgi:hypothetical protein
VPLHSYPTPSRALTLFGAVIGYADCGLIPLLSVHSHVHVIHGAIGPLEGEGALGAVPLPAGGAQQDLLVEAGAVADGLLDGRIVQMAVGGRVLVVDLCTRGQGSGV